MVADAPEDDPARDELGLSGRVRRIQTGFVRSYALSMFTGAALVAAAMLAVRIW